jgi:hypothetical protein
MSLSLTPEIGKLHFMTSQPTSPSPIDAFVDSGPAPSAPEDLMVHPDDSIDWLAEPEAPVEPGAGGRLVLGWTLSLLAAAWIGLSAWSAGRALADQAFSAPALAQWLAIAAGPLALLGLIWLVFGRTRRREAEAFTRSVVAMRQESRALEGLLAVLRQRIDENHAALRTMSGELMSLGDEATHRLGATTAQLGEGARLLASQGDTLDRAAQSARVDIGVLLEDLPRAEATAHSMAQRLRDAGAVASEQASRFEQRVATLTQRTQEADVATGNASEKLLALIDRLQDRGAAVANGLQEVAASSDSTIDRLLERTAAALGEVRSGIDVQAEAVAALVDQSSAGLGQSGFRAAEAMRQSLGDAGGSLDAFSARIVEQDERSRALLADIDQGLQAIDQRFQLFANQGDERATAVGATLALVRAELDAISERSGASDDFLASIGGRAEGLRLSLDAIDATVREQLTGSLTEAEQHADRLRIAAQTVQPAIMASRDAAVEASTRLEQGAALVESQHDRLAALLAAIDTGVGGAERRLGDLADTIAKAEREAARLSSETGPALVASLVQVKEAAAHAAERAREAIAAIIPQSAANLSSSARDALERAVRETVDEQMAEIARTADRAVETARSASERLMQQMLSIGQTAAALEVHMTKSQADQRDRDSESFGRRVSLLIDSMHSASIDVGKILSDDVDDKAWSSYLKGDRAVFTRRAVRLIGGSETRALANHYDEDVEFRDSANRYVHDFEAMLRRVTMDRDGGPMAVTLMSSDMGKLYAALSPIVGTKR